MPTLMSRRLLRSAAIAVGATLLTCTIAVASPPKWIPKPGDDRATAYSGNVTTCAAAHLPGTTVTWPNLEDQTGTYVTITAANIPAGDVLIAVVVKGGPGYNVYKGLTSWTNLHSPINVGGQIPTISHWFACVGKQDNGGGTTTTTTTTTTMAGGSTTTTTTAAAGGSTTTTTTNGAAAGSTTTMTSGAAVAGANTPNTTGTQNLAFTGFGNSWLIWAGVLLLLVGGCVVALPRLARRRS